MEVRATVEKKDGMGFWQWVSVVGIGTALLAYFVPWLMKQNAAMQDRVIEQSAKSAEAMASAADSMDDLTDSIGDMVTEQQEFRRDLQPLVRQLDRFTDVAEEIAADRDSSAEPPP